MKMVSVESTVGRFVNVNLPWLVDKCGNVCKMVSRGPSRHVWSELPSVMCIVRQV